MNADHHESLFLLSWPIIASVSARCDGVELERWELTERPDDVPSSHPGFSLSMSWDDRALALQRQMENNQDYLRAFFGFDGPICLDLVREPITNAERVLGKRGIEIRDISLDVLRRENPKILRRMSERELFKLLVDWSCEIEGADRSDEWINLADPDRAEMCRSWVGGVDWREAVIDEDRLLRSAQTALKSMADPPLAEFTFGDYLRWMYYHRTELSPLQPYQMRALVDLARLTLD